MARPLSEPLPTRFQPGDVLAKRFRVEQELGRGGMAVVYLAHDAKHESRVALKVLSYELSSAVGTLRFLQEIKVTAGLQHPHILPAYDSGITEDGALFYVMPYMEGGSLRRRIEAEKQLPIQSVVQITGEIADGLAFAHERGIVHRDIKPENILFLGGHALLADFGIARLLTGETAERLTMQGSVLGTPAYMSPEQGFALPVDARADVYSLACVVYEMLTGAVPFTAASAGVWMEGRLSRIPASLRSYRPELPPAMDEVVIRALAPSPSDRFQSVREFSEALENAAGESRGGRRFEVHRARRSGMLLGVTIAVVALAGTAALTTPVFRNALVSLGFVKLDSTRVFVAPFQSADPASAGPARSAERLLREELERWEGVRVVSASATGDAMSDTERPTVEDAMRGARKSRAALVLWGRAQAEAGGGAMRIDVQLFDGRTGSSRVDHQMRLVAGSEPRPAEVQATVATLLAGTEAALAPRAIRAAGATHTLGAWRAYVEGHRALSDWRLAAAESAFAASAATDPRFPQPRAWLAQSMVWNRRGARSEWRRHAQEALLHAGKLDTTDLLVARAMDALGNREDPRACAAYTILVARDSLSAHGWLGLGDCQAIDSVVVRDARSPSGFAFRGSFWRATAAYERAVRLAPGAHSALPFAFVEVALPTLSNRYRHGVGAGGANQMFAARPSASGDTVAYVPRPVIGNALPPDPPGFEEGLERNRMLLLEYVTAWVQRAPSSAEAFEALAAVRESRSELMRSGGEGWGSLSAFDALETALRLSTNREARARIGAARVRVVLKTGDFARARALGDSLLAAASVATPGEAHWLAGVAAFTGRTRDAVRLARLGRAPPVSSWDTLPPALAEAATTLLLHSAYGVCGQELTASFERLDDMIDSYTAPAYREASRKELMDRPRLLAVPCLGTRVVAGNSAASIWGRMAQHHARGDTAAVRAAFDTSLATRRYRRPGGTALDYTFLESWLLSAIGDTVAAARHLDLTLSALPTLNQYAVGELAQAATVGRAMAWRADLAFRRGDAQNGRRWASAVVELWKSADAELQPVVNRMRGITNSR